MALPTLLLVATAIGFLLALILYFAPLPPLVGRVAWILFLLLLLGTAVVFLTSPAFGEWVQNAKFEPANFVRDLWENQIFTD